MFIDIGRTCWRLVLDVAYCFWVRLAKAACVMIWMACGGLLSCGLTFVYRFYYFFFLGQREIDVLMGVHRGTLCPDVHLDHGVGCSNATHVSAIVSKRCLSFDFIKFIYFSCLYLPKNDTVSASE